MTMLFALVAATALAVTPEEVASRLQEVEPLRAGRLGSAAPTVPAEAWAQAAGGDVVTGVEKVEGGGAKKAWGVAVVDAPIGRYFSAINDDVNKAKATALEHVVLLDGQTCGARRVVFQYLPVPLVTDRWWVVEQRINESLQASSEGRVREMAWEDVADAEERLARHAEAGQIAAGGMSVAFTRGGWWLVDLDGKRTLVEYWTWADPGGSLPAGPVSSFAAGGIEELIEAMEKLAASGPACQL